MMKDVYILLGTSMVWTDRAMISFLVSGVRRANTKKLIICGVFACLLTRLSFLTTLFWVSIYTCTSSSTISLTPTLMRAHSQSWAPASEPPTATTRA